MLTIDRIAGSALSLFALWVIWESRKLPLGALRNPGPAFVPVLLASLLLLLGILIVGTGGRAGRFRSLVWSELPHAGAIIAACVFAAFFLERLGYRITLLLILLFLLKAVEKRGWLLAALFSFAFSFGSFFLFYTLLRVPLPLGPWGI